MRAWCVVVPQERGEEVRRRLMNLGVLHRHLRIVRERDLLFIPTTAPVDLDFPTEQREFVDAFTHRLLVAYGKTVRATGNEHIQFGQEVRDGQQASVETQVVSGNGDQTPIDYRLHDIDGQWMVYDVVIERVSIVNNYRSQFERVIAKSSVQDLLRIMKQQDS